MQDEYSITELCDALGVTRSGYHAWASRQPGPRAQTDTLLLPLIESAHLESRQTYGSPRIVHWLRQRGHRCGRMRVSRFDASHRSISASAPTLSANEFDRQQS